MTFAAHTLTIAFLFTMLVKTKQLWVCGLFSNITYWSLLVEPFYCFSCYIGKGVYSIRCEWVVGLIAVSHSYFIACIALQLGPSKRRDKMLTVVTKFHIKHSSPLLFTVNWWIVFIWNMFRVFVQMTSQAALTIKHDIFWEYNTHRAAIKPKQCKEYTDFALKMKNLCL